MISFRKLIKVFLSECSHHHKPSQNYRHEGVGVGGDLEPPKTKSRVDDPHFFYHHSFLFGLLYNYVVVGLGLYLYILMLTFSNNNSPTGPTRDLL